MTDRDGMPKTEAHIDGSYVRLPARHADDILPELKALIFALDGLRAGSVPAETYGWLTLLAEERVEALEKLFEADARRETRGGRCGG